MPGRVVSTYISTGGFLIGILIVMAVIFVASLAIPLLKVKLMPALLSGFTIVLTVIALIQELRAGAKEIKPTDDEGDEIEEEEGVTISGFFKAFGWFVLLIAGVYCFGFIIAIPLWVFVYLWKNGHRWWTSMLQGVGVIVVMYLVFAVSLQIELYQGLVFELLKRQLGL